MHAQVPVLIIIGPVGIGKSSTADALSEALEYDHALPHAVVDLDHVRRGFPPPQDDPFNKELGFSNLAAVWSNYRSHGAKCLIIPSVMESQADLNEIRRSVPGAELFLVRLVASLEVNHARIRGREKTFESLNWHLRRSAQLAAELAVKKLEHVVVDAENKPPSEIAREIIRRWGIVEWHRSTEDGS
ncbi:hypothetical protein SAMN02799624_04111 [Paenibacillus sp. UNC496MF]|uniref:hypothetical protein n=1 Tax=Paenibacillus sp. UNC496MF TaxID=1502753 RepID=UPI0008E89F15|nr:hypothetical protein [Paenibacillus sp. UNC496MF]SFJ33364.1 hypothetical protein SAMN02799624_04111 [Paenibacillus sp. UNC496MF]